ncbi:iron chelate uptake ABC transporter family permease subunit [Skermania sp. ID1734]|uniref:FecCD family ABC transporter permease n=1 Tax=Skermania sp. ID1734 TaxID=2597516 RepID=UPI00117E73FA|nr:iron chelate uptake ABC transporter family permease subunit [Skermania sp. ID1734]TSE01426.1 iron chelate uptake ABC transporter family permease subunit [Skermania sp. ID1734]
MSTLLTKLGPVSGVRRPTATLIVAALVAVALLLACIDIGRGDFPLSVAQVLDVLSGGGTRAQRYIVLDVRMPRAVVAALAGAALGVAGALTQSILRNPLAGPDMLGITTGSACAAVAFIVAGGAGLAGGLFAVGGTFTAALVGGAATALLLYVLAWRSGPTGFSGLRIVLIGIGLNALLLAVISWLLVYADIVDVARAQVWLNGSVNSATWSQVGPLTIGLAAATGLAMYLSRTIAALRFGADKAMSLGVDLQRSQAAALALAVVLASLATAATGPIGFVALSAPQISRYLLRRPIEPVLTSAVVGAVIVVAADIVARTMLPVELPVGIVTSALGAVFLVYLLVQTNLRRSV